MDHTKTFTWSRQPVHTVYGGANLFSATTCTKLASLAQRSFAEYAPDAQALADALELQKEFAAAVHTRVGEKLAREAVEDFRIDFEDGFGIRSNAEEDAAAIQAAQATAAAMTVQSLPPFFGIRIKSLSGPLADRARRTLGLYLNTLLGSTGGTLPANFVVTLPKISKVEEIRDLTLVLEPYPQIGIEIMVETPQSIFLLPQMVEAAEGHCVAAHFGAYDYTASLGITSAVQSLLHPACDFARNMMLAALAPTGIWLSDGASTVLPIPPHRSQDLSDLQKSENRSVVHAAWKLHYDLVRHSLHNGFYQGWDLHPAQIPARYAAVHAFFLEGMIQASSRLRNFVSTAAQATHVAGVFDDAATGQGLLNYFLRAINCGAITETDVPQFTGLSLEELHTGSFVDIATRRTNTQS